MELVYKPSRELALIFCIQLKYSHAKIEITQNIQIRFRTCKRTNKLFITLYYNGQRLNL